MQTIPTLPPGTTLIALCRPTGDPKKFEILAFINLRAQDTRIVDERQTPMLMTLLGVSGKNVLAVEDILIDVSTVDELARAAIDAMHWANVINLEPHDNVIIQFTELTSNEALTIASAAEFIDYFHDHLPRQ